MPRTLPLFFDAVAVGVFVEYVADLHRHSRAADVGLAVLVLLAVAFALAAHWAAGRIRNHNTDTEGH